MNPFAGAAMFGGGMPSSSSPSTRGSGFFRGAPVVEAPRQQHVREQKQQDRNEGISKQVSVPQPHHTAPAPKVPCSNVPTRTLRRVNAFASRDWTAGIMPIASIDADFHVAPQPTVAPQRQVAQDISLASWSVAPVEVKEPAKKNIWAFTSNIGKRSAMGIKAVGESDGDSSGLDDDKDDDTWLNDLKETMQQAMQENDEKACFHFEWLAHSNTAGSNASTASPSVAPSASSVPSSHHHSIFHKH